MFAPQHARMQAQCRLMGRKPYERNASAHAQHSHQGVCPSYTYLAPAVCLPANTLAQRSLTAPAMRCTATPSAARCEIKAAAVPPAARMKRRAPSRRAHVRSVGSNENPNAGLLCEELRAPSGSKHAAALRLKVFVSVRLSASEVGARKSLDFYPRRSSQPEEPVQGVPTACCTVALRRACRIGPKQGGVLGVCACSCAWRLAQRACAHSASNSHRVSLHPPD